MGWYMKIHEYQAKDLLAAEGAKIPVGIIANSPEEAIKAFDHLGGKPVVLKAQVHAGGRGKGRFKWEEVCSGRHGRPKRKGLFEAGVVIANDSRTGRFCFCGF